MPSSNASAALRRVPTQLLLVGGLHLVVVWALINGLHVRLSTPVRPGDIVASMIDRPQPPPEHLAAPDVRPTPINFTPRPVIADFPPSQSDAALAITPDVQPQYLNPGDVSLPQAQPTITGAAVDPRHPLSQPPYPPAAIRGGEEGKLSLEVLVGPDGRVVDAKVARSSGSERLDEAAVKEARSHWRLRPATRDGVPFAQWLTLGVVFRLEGR